MPAQKFAEKMQGFGSAEAFDFLAIFKQDDRREPAYLVVTGKLHIFPLIDFQLGKTHTAIEFQQGFLQQGRNDDTRGAPVRPKINQYRNLVRGIQHSLIEIAQMDVVYGMS